MSMNCKMHLAWTFLKKRRVIGNSKLPQHVNTTDGTESLEQDQHSIPH